MTGKRIKYPTLKIKGVPRDLKFTLYNMLDHLARGGTVEIIFNGDGTIFTARKSGRKI